MATAEEIGDGLEFLSDPVDRFPLPDLEATDFDQDGETDTILTQSATDSSMGDVRDPTPTVQLAINSTCDALTLSATNSQCSAKEEGDEAPGWAKRVRVGRAPIERPPCAGRVSALEKSLRGYAEKKTETVVVPAVGNNFDSLGEAYDYYNLYYWEIGFGIRYGKSRLNVERTKCMQEIVCGCSGKPKKGNTRTCRCECPAMIRLLRSNDSGWYICEHRPSHNHVLTAKCGENLYWPSHKHIDIYTRDLVKQLRENNISIGKVYNIIGSFFGSMSNVPFSKRALRGLCGEISCWHICYHPLLLAPRHQDHLPKSFLIKALYARDHRMLHVENPKINVVQHENLLTSQTNKNQTVFFVMLSSTVALAVPERTDGNQKDELFAPCSHTQTATSSQLPSDNQQRIRTN